MNTEIGISKFKNMNAVTCYMNSILAILQQLPLFSDYIVSGNFKELLKNDNYEQTVIFQLHKLFRISLSMDNANLTPSTLRGVCANKDYVWGEQQQQDSAEFLQFIITRIEEEVGQNVSFLSGYDIKESSTIKNSLEMIQAMSSYQLFTKKEYSPLKKLFTGLDQTSTECKVCGNKKSNFQTFPIWQLPIPVNEKNLNREFDITECMDKWMETEELDDENRLLCDFCGLKTNITKSYKLFNTPKILIIQLKRFKKDMYGNVSRKITNKVNFPINNFDVSKYVSDSNTKKEKCIYNLVGVNIHHELGGLMNLNVGHYVSIVKNRYDNNWYLFNDDEEPKKVECDEDLINSKSYLLFYYRVD